MPVILPPGDPAIARLAATALRAASTLPERLAWLRQVALAEAGRLEGQARGTAGTAAAWCAGEIEERNNKPIKRCCLDLCYRNASVGSI